MKKIIWNVFVTILVITAVIGDVNMAKSSQTQDMPEPAICNLPLEAAQSKGFAVEKENVDAWAPTFQLCWNELINLIDRNNNIEFIKGNPPIANQLNKQKFIKEDLNPDSYYIKTGKMTLPLKKQIEKDIKTKFNETSDILDKFQFPNIAPEKTNKYFIYSMLIKNFPFKYMFTDIKPKYFADNKIKRYKFFGLSNNSEEKSKQISNTTNIFYASDDDFALKLYNDDESEEMMLYLTDSDASFDDIYTEMIEKSKQENEFKTKRIDDIINQNPLKYNNKEITVKYNTDIQIPYLSIDEEINYNEELAGKQIKGKDFEKTGEYWEIEKTIQTIKFNLDNKGAKLKSEAAIQVMRATAAMHIPQTIILNNYYYFDRPFVIFLKETNKDKPYFAARIKDGKYLVKD